MLVLGSGALFILVLLPFTFIQFVFMPWMDAREAARAPRRLPEDTSDHLVLTRLDAIAEDLVARAREAGLRARCSVSVIGMWHRGRLEMAHPDAEILETTVPILAGSQEQLDEYDRELARSDVPDALVLILGGGRVGRAAASDLDRAGIRSVIVEERSERIRSEPTTCNAADVARRTPTNIEAIEHDGEMQANPDPTQPLPRDATLVVIGDDEAKSAFRDRFPPASS